MPFDLERDFAENTSLHGISRILSAKSVVLKIIWSVVFLVAFGLFIWQFYDRIWTYFQYEFNTLVEIEHFPSLVFPAITICNYNRFWKSRVSDKYLKHLDSFQGFAGAADYYEYDYEEGTNNNNSFLDDLEDDFDIELFAYEAGFRLNDSLISCEWKGRKGSCSAKNFTKLIIPEYGVCYTFNDDNSYKIVSQSIPGNGNGLSLLLNIDQDDYTETFNEGHHEAGIRFVVHTTRDPPLVDSLGLSVPPGFHSYVSIRQNKFENLPKPHGTCLPDSKVEGNRPYSNKECLIDCRLEFIINECNCRPLGYYGRPESKICSPAETTGCVKKALMEFKSTSSHQKCGCPKSCIDTTYTQTISMTLYPSEMVKQDLQSQVNTLFPTPQANSSTLIDFGKNLVYLDLYYDELSVTTFKQVPAMTWSALLADLGGQMGLFLGMSAITATEVIDYIIRRLFRLLRRAAPPSNNKVVELVAN